MNFFFRIEEGRRRRVGFWEAGIVFAFACFIGLCRDVIEVENVVEVDACTSLVKRVRRVA